MYFIGGKMKTFGETVTIIFVLIVLAIALIFMLIGMASIVKSPPADARQYGILKDSTAYGIIYEIYDRQKLIFEFTTLNCDSTELKLLETLYQGDK
jgi:hypothetical protein